jgi:hypothetical protein
MIATILRTCAVAAVTIGLIASTGAQSMGANPDVVGNNTIAAYVGTGGLLLPDSFSGSEETRWKVSECLGCTWQYTIYCMQGTNEPCKHAVTSCPRGSLLHRVWFGRDANSLEVIGSVCWGSTTPITRRQVESQVEDYVIRYLPPLLPGFDPPGGSITAVPVIFWTGQPTSFKPPGFLLSGHWVSISAKPTWRWTWGDGDSSWKIVPGAHYPSRQITHQYRIPERYNVSVIAVWQANYTVSGIGTFDVGGEVIRQTKTLAVPISTARTIRISHQ